jgi:D-arabinose 1-dehydrogenase-like Zn-dependent alcohol dehydrogenase
MSDKAKAFYYLSLVTCHLSLLFSVIIKSFQEIIKFMSKQTRVLVTGAGGFIGHHLVNYLVDRGYWVRGVDVKEPE